MTITNAAAALNGAAAYTECRRPGCPVTIVGEDGLCDTCRFYLAVHTPPELVGHEVVHHSAHINGHKFSTDRWMIRSLEKPSRDDLSRLGIPAGATYSHAELINKAQHWVYFVSRTVDTLLTDERAS